TSAAASASSRTSSACSPRSPWPVLAAAASTLAPSSSCCSSRPDMLALHYERRHKVLAITVAGVLSSEDLADPDRVVLRFLAGREGVRGLYDLSAVDAVAVPVSR